MTNQYNFSDLQAFNKRFFDLIISFPLLFIFLPLIVLLATVCFILYRENGIFVQRRVGLNGKFFYLYKLKTMITSNNSSTVTILGDCRITKFGSFLRRWKLDELPQLFNVIVGDMSIVGPRPDVDKYYKLTKGIYKNVYNIRPGITGPASIKYKNEEYLLSLVKDPISYNDKVIFPDKLQINLDYIKNYSLYKDFYYLIRTFF